MPINQTEKSSGIVNSPANFYGRNATGSVTTQIEAAQAGKKVRIFWVSFSGAGTHEQKLAQGSTVKFSALTSAGVQCNLHFGEYPLEFSINLQPFNWTATQSVAGTSIANVAYEVVDE